MLPYQLDELNEKDEIKDFFQIDKSFCPESGYQLQHSNGKGGEISRSLLHNIYDQD